MITALEETAVKIISLSPGAVVHFRLLRDVLKKLPADSDYQQARDQLKNSRCIQELADEQWPSGGWGAFHSRSTRLKQKIPSTEVGVERAIALGLDASHPILQRASAYIAQILQGELPFPDYQEKNDRWQTGKRLFLASTLSLIQPGCPALNADRALWRAIAERTFHSGKYNADDERRAHAELTGATVKDSYLELNGRYQLNILGSLPGTISAELERALLSWLWEHRGGIGYLGVPLRLPPPVKTGTFDRWLSSLELLVRLFPASADVCQPSIDWLWEQRDEEGYWDFGPKPGSGSFLPLSDNWRNTLCRKCDWTTRILILLRNYAAHPHACGEYGCVG